MKITTPPAVLLVAAAVVLITLALSLPPPAAAGVARAVTLAPGWEATPPPYTLAVTDTAVTITNTSAKPQDVSATINQTWGWHVGVAGLPGAVTLPAGRSVTVPLGRFCRETGERFNAATHAVLSVDLGYSTTISTRDAAVRTCRTAATYRVSDD